MVAAQTDREIASLPKVSGGEPYLSRTSNDVLHPIFVLYTIINKSHAIMFYLFPTLF